MRNTKLFTSIRLSRSEGRNPDLRSWVQPRAEYKPVDGVYKKRKVRLCMIRKQQKGEHYQLGELYAPVMKATEVLLFMSIAARHEITVTVLKSETKQAPLNWDIADEKLYNRVSGWWLQRVPDSGEACPTAHEKNVRDAAGSSALACAQ
jgi:hypothetical protein